MHRRQSTPPGISSPMERWSLLFSHAEYDEIARTTMALLTASDVASLLAALGIKPSPYVQQEFLNPLRDVDHTLRTFEPWFRDKCQILMLGPDSLRLTARILRPDSYFKKKGKNEAQLKVWIVAIAPSFQEDAKRALHLQRRSKQRSLPMEIRAAALAEGEGILQKRVIRQCAMEVMEPSTWDQVGDGSFTVHRDNLDVIGFDLFNSTPIDCRRSARLGLEFAGMEFWLPWDMRNPTSKTFWNANDGIPYIDAADPFEMKLAAKRSTRSGGFQKLKCLVFYRHTPEWDPQSTVVLPVGPSLAGMESV
ncbi:hypothetical protein BJY01DRAFT_230616 [Aspergillus pseudoustus]|uniref:Uncharacterized protein n=1 Tax=Aspergillus pseudoustus TaxID=1810923 RepID=A0ABR4I7M3_9EURO